MLRRCLWLVCALTSCASPPTTREGWLASVSSRSEGLCWWRNARWEDRAPLLVRGTGQPFAHARVKWAGELWRGTSITGVLRRAGPLVVLQGDWVGPGLTLAADVDVTQSAVFRAFEPRRVGSAGLMLKGSHVRVHDASIGHALVVPDEDALAAFLPQQPVALEVGCDALSLSSIPEVTGDVGRRLLAQSGFASDAPERWVPRHAQVPASAQFGGPTVGLFLGAREPVRGFVVEQREAEARLVVPTPGGVVWVGWVSAADLQTPTASPPAVESAPAPGRAAPSGGEWRSCERDELPLSVALNGKTIEVGLLQPGTAFSILSGSGEYREVALGVEWLELERGVHLLLPERAARCPRAKQLGAW